MPVFCIVDTWYYSKQLYLIISTSHLPRISRGGVLSFIVDNIGFIFEGANFGQNTQPEPWDCGGVLWTNVRQHWTGSERLSKAAKCQKEQLCFDESRGSSDDKKWKIYENRENFGQFSGSTGSTEGGCVRKSNFVSGKADLCQTSLIFSISNLSSLIVLIMMLTKGG